MSEVGPMRQQSPMKPRSSLPSRKQLATAGLFAAVSAVVMIGSGTTNPRLASALDEPDRPLARAEVRDLGFPAKASKILEKDSRIAVNASLITNSGGTNPLPESEHVDLRRAKNGDLVLNKLPSFSSRLGDRVVSTTNRNDYVFYTLQGALQDHVERLIEKASVPHVAIVVMNPRTGAILAMGGKSLQGDAPQLMNSFPTASLFKVITAAAAIEAGEITPDTAIRFRGGDYTLNLGNYLPDARRDTRSMSVAEALARSCNPVFGQIGGQFLSSRTLERYVQLFGFNTNLGFDAPLSASRAVIPDSDDLYGITRTAAGFGNVSISPVHAAAIASALGNGGLLPKPRIIDRVVSQDGVVIHRSEPVALQRVIRSTTAKTLLEMMELTTTIGTSRKEFIRAGSQVLPGLSVAAKTGTLQGQNPKGLTNWFMATAPVENPTVALAVVVVDPSHSMRASFFGRKVFEKFFNITPAFADLPRPALRSPVRKFSRAKFSKITHSKGIHSKGKKAKKPVKVSKKTPKRRH